MDTNIDSDSLLLQTYNNLHLIEHEHYSLPSEWTSHFNLYKFNQPYSTKEGSVSLDIFPFSLFIYLIHVSCKSLFIE